MKSIKSIALSAAVLAASVSMVACQKKTETTSDGIEYTYIKEGKEKPKDGEYVVYHYTARTDKDSVFLSSYDFPTPGYMQYQDSVDGEIEGINEIFQALKKGDSIVVNATAEKIIGPGLPPFLSTGQNISLSIGVVDVLEEQVFQDYFNDLFEASQKKQTDKDVQILEEYIAENNLNATKTESGLFYVIEEEGDGPEVEAGSTVSENYTGYVLDGRVFDTSSEEVAKANNKFMEGRPYEPNEFQVGMGRDNPGRDEGLQHVRKGSKAKLLMRSTLAYGNQQVSEEITANSVLIFDVGVTDVK